MAISISKADGNTTLTFTMTGLSTKVDPLIAKWAEYDYKHGFATIEGVEFADTTNQQKLAAINARLKAVGLAEANAQLDQDAKDAAEAAKETYDLERVNGG